MLSLVLVSAILVMIPRLFWSTVIEGQIGKQGFVAHMIQSFYSGNIEQGFPLRFFIEPWHPGVIPWAEEVPLYHLLTSAVAHLFHVEPIHAARGVSFVFFLVLLWSVFEMAKIIFPPQSKAPLLSVAMLAWFPGAQIYGTSVIPDMAMLGSIALAILWRMKSKRELSYLALLIASLFKYFAFFAILGFFVFDFIELKGWKKKFQSLLLAALAALPTLAYLVYFIVEKIPNPVTEYRVNGYGHLAGPFLFQIKFYLRYLLWVFVKNPTLIVSLMSFYGVFLLWKRRRVIPQASVWVFLLVYFGAYTLFALVFASSFFVHDYYALPFMIPVLLASVYGVISIKSKWMQGVFFTAALASGVMQSRGAIIRQEHYQEAATQVSEVLISIPDNSRDELCIFITDFSQPPIPVISKKSGWSFVADRYQDQSKFYDLRLNDPRTKAVVFYLQETPAEVRASWEAHLGQWTKVKDSLIQGKSLLIYLKNDISHF